MVVSILIFDKSFRNVLVSEVSRSRTWIYSEMLCIISVSKRHRERCEHLLRIVGHIMETDYIYILFFHLVYYICTVRILFKLACDTVTLGDSLQRWKNTDSATECL